MFKGLQEARWKLEAPLGGVLWSYEQMSPLDLGFRKVWGGRSKGSEG